MYNERKPAQSHHALLAGFGALTLGDQYLLSLARELFADMSVCRPPERRDSRLCQGLVWRSERQCMYIVWS